MHYCMRREQVLRVTDEDRMRSFLPSVWHLALVCLCVLRSACVRFLFTTAKFKYYISTSIYVYIYNVVI